MVAVKTSTSNLDVLTTSLDFFFPFFLLFSFLVDCFISFFVIFISSTSLFYYYVYFLSFFYIVL